MSSGRSITSRRSRTATTSAIKAAVEALTQASHKLAEMMYQQAAKDKPEGGGGASAGGGQGKKKDDDNVVDADFEEVK
jgi:molecular chaperone DnaK